MMSAAVLFLGAGCLHSTSFAQPSQDPVPSEVSSLKNVYVSSRLGVMIHLADGVSNQLQEEGNKITAPQDPNFAGQYIQVFHKEETQSVERAIEDLLRNQGKDPGNCRIVAGAVEPNGNQEYTVELAESLTYTSSQMEDIAAADREVDVHGGFEDGAYIKKRFYNEVLIDRCSFYADPLGLGTSKSIPSRFVMNSSKTDTTYVFLPGSADPTFYGYGQIEFIAK